MLKLTLEKGKSLERHVEAAAKFLSRLVEQAQDTGWARIYAYPRPASLAAGAAMFSLISSFGVRPIFSVSLDPPSRVEVPTVLLGYPGGLDYSTGDVDTGLLAVSPRIESPPPPNAVYVDGDGSVPGILGMLILWIGGLFLRRDVLSLLVSGLYYGGRMDKVGRLYGIDAAFYERVSSLEIMKGIGVVTSLKAYRPLTRRLCESISSTLNPFYPGITGDKEGCFRVLAAAGLERVAEQSLASLGRDDLKLVVKAVVSMVREEAGREVDLEEFVGGIIVSEEGQPEDYRMLSDAIVYAVETVRGADPLLGLASYFQEEVSIIYKIVENGAPDCAELVERFKSRRVKSAPWLRVYEAPEEVSSPTILWKALSLLGKVERESVIAVPSDEGYIVSAIQIEESMGYGEARKLRGIKVLEGDGMLLRLRLREQ